MKNKSPSKPPDPPASIVIAGNSSGNRFIRTVVVGEGQAVNIKDNAADNVFDDLIHVDSAKSLETVKPRGKFGSLVRIFVGAMVTIIGGLTVVYVAHRLGWNG